MLDIISRLTSLEDSSLKGSQLLRGRTAASVKVLEESLAAARQTVAELTAEEANLIADSEAPDTLPATDKKLLKARESVRQLEAGLAVAIERDQAAQAALERAKLLASIAEEERAFARLKNEVAPKADQLFASVQTYIENELVPAIDTARAVSGAGSHQSFLIDLTLGFEMMFLRAAQKIIPKGRAHVVSLGDRTFASLVPDPSTVAKRRGVEK